MLLLRKSSKRTRTWHFTLHQTKWISASLKKAQQPQLNTVETELQWVGSRVLTYKLWLYNHRSSRQLFILLCLFLNCQHFFLSITFSVTQQRVNINGSWSFFIFQRYSLCHRTLLCKMSESCCHRSSSEETMCWLVMARNQIKLR